MKEPDDPESDAIFSTLKMRDGTNRVDEEKLVLKVADGMEQQIKCIG